jgi:chaperonin GroEL
MNPLDLKRGAQMAVDKVVSIIDQISRPISTKAEISQVGTISSNGEKEIGDLLAEAMERVGKEGVITVQDGKTLNNELEVIEGMRFDRGYISPYFITDNKSQTVEFENPLILLVEKKISTLQSIVPLLESVVKSHRPLVIIAEDVESEALATLVVNKLRGGLKVVAVKAPGFGDNRKATLQDVAVITGGQVISEELGLKLETVTDEQLGSCSKVKISKDDTIIAKIPFSTSIEFENAENWINYKTNCCLWAIKVPVETKFLCINNPNEGKEIILPAGKLIIENTSEHKSVKLFNCLFVPNLEYQH